MDSIKKKCRKSPIIGILKSTFGISVKIAQNGDIEHIYLKSDYIVSDELYFNIGEEKVLAQVNKYTLSQNTTPSGACNKC